MAMSEQEKRDRANARARARSLEFRQQIAKIESANATALERARRQARVDAWRRKNNLDLIE